MSKIAYHQIIQQWDRYEAAYHYLEHTFGVHAPYMHPDLVAYLVQSVEAGTSEGHFKHDARTMYHF